MKAVLQRLSEVTRLLRSSDFFGYRERTQVERLLFLAARQLCHDQLNYDLGGLTSQHKARFEDHIGKVRSAAIHDEILGAFRIGELLRDLQAHDPYDDLSLGRFDSDRHVAAIAIANELDALSLRLMAASQPRIALECQRRLCSVSCMGVSSLGVACKNSDVR